MRRSRVSHAIKPGYKESRVSPPYLHVDITAGSLTSAIDLLFYNLCSIREISSIVGQFSQRSLKSAGGNDLISEQPRSISMQSEGNVTVLQKRLPLSMKI